MKTPYENTENPNVTIIEPSPGSFVILGHNPQSQLDESGAHVVPMPECYVASEVPTSALLHILAERGIEVTDESEKQEGETEEKPKRGRPRKVADESEKQEGAE